jgi:hypothetical protein
MATPNRTPSPLRALAALLAALACAAGATSAADAQTTANGGAPAGSSPQPRQSLPVTQPPDGTAFDGSGMWIWMLSRSSGGNVNAIAARARAAGVSTVFVKSSDAGSVWSQFSTALVRALHARGLRVCGWGYVYGTRPAAEALAARAAIRRGADCFVIDAEAEYEGRYVSASSYMTLLRRYAGARYPIGLAPFPYVDYHPAYPYSVFLGPGGAQFNLPQMYWKAIGTTVPAVYAHTYSYSSLYERPIYPLGQTYGGVSRGALTRFRQYAQSLGARGVSWWDWQETTSWLWRALGLPLPVLPASRALLPIAPTLKRGARGDTVVWAQQHLLGVGRSVKLTGVLDTATARAIKTVQAANGLPATGALDPVTWRALLARAVAKVRWRPAGAVAAASGRSAPPPRSASLPPVRNELRGARER